MNSKRKLLLAVLLASAACSSPHSSKAADSKDPRVNRAEPVSDADWNAARKPRPHGEPQAVRFTDFRSNRHLALVNESHTDAAEQYSQQRKLEDSMTKIGHDEVVAALLERFESNGFFKVAEEGPAPQAGVGVWVMTLEVERKGGLRHLSLGASSSVKEREVFSHCNADFIQLYSDVLGLQAVQQPPDWQSQKPSGVPPKH
jgi:hypothetical protein